MGVSLYAFDACSYSVDNANKYIKGFYLSIENQSNVGVRADYNYFMYHAKGVEVNCKGKNVTIIRKMKKQIMKHKKQWDNS